MQDNGSDYEYKIKVKRLDISPRSVTIIVITESIFGVANNIHGLFRDVVNNTNSFAVSALTNEKIKFSFGMHNVFVPDTKQT
jgi:hypothetical protein